MPRKTKRQLQISKIPRKKGRYVSQDQITIEDTKLMENETFEERMEGEIDKEWSEGEIIELIEDEAVNGWIEDGIGKDWTEKDLKEFEDVGKKFVTETLRWHEDATHNIRAVYTGNSRTTTWRKEKKKEKLKEDAKEMRTIDTFFKNFEKSSSSRPSPSLSSESSSLLLQPSQPFLFSSDNLRICLEEINQQCLLSKSAKENEKLFTYDHLRRLSIRRFIQLLLDGQGKMDASNNIAQTLWNKGDYMACCIRKWGTHFIKTGELLAYRQGKHSKLTSLLNDEDFKEECQIWIRQQAPESRSPKNLKMHIEEIIFPKLTGYIKKDTISERTCRTYMHLWGYKYDEKKKGIYYDGHERPDVVMYRKEWLKRMFEYKKSMKDFDGDMLDIVLEPQLKSGEKELVQVTHDECHFYANDGQRRIWIRKDEDILRSKHIGRSIMVSAFLCQCHGLLQLSDEQLQTNPHVKNKESFVLRSIQKDGYWKSEHMLDQV
jgi:hypothetical protein